MPNDWQNNRKSLHGAYDFDTKTGWPRNIVGRTGLAGRGRLGLKMCELLDKKFYFTVF